MSKVPAITRTSGAISLAYSTVFLDLMVSGFLKMSA